MRLLLTSGGVSHPSLRAALVDLLGRPVEQCHALAIPTALHGHAQVGPHNAVRFLTGETDHLAGLGWASVGLLELTALPSIDRDRWTSWVREADVLLAAGGDAAYLAHWVRASGLADLLLADDGPAPVWVGMSAGSMAVTPRVGADFVTWPSEGADDRTLGWVDFSLFPHLEHPMLPDNTLDAARTWAADLGHPAYALDDASAVVVDGDRVRVVSGGRWEKVG